MFLSLCIVMHCFIISSELKLARHGLNLVYMYVHKTNLFTQILWRRIKQMTILTKQYWALISKIHCFNVSKHNTKQSIHNKRQ